MLFSSYFLENPWIAFKVLKQFINRDNMAAEKGGGGGGGGGGATGAFCPGPHSAMGPQRSIYSNRTVKYSIKAVTTYILPWAPQALSAALAIIIL